MSASLFSAMSWLPRPPQDFRRQVRALRDRKDDLGRAIRALASYALDENELGALAGAIETARQAKASLEPLIPFRLAILGNGTLDFIAPPLIASAARHGILLECVKGGYDQIVQEAVSPASQINRARPNAVLLALDYRGLPLDCKLGDAEGAIAQVLDFYDTVRAGLRRNGEAISIVQTLAPPVETVFGSLDRAVPGTPRSLISEINKRLVDTVANSDDLILDVDGLAQTVGLAEWYEPTFWNMAKLPFASQFLPLYADHFARLIAALKGMSRRCLVLDLDNTLWGGVIGDDGLDGIKLAQGDPTGEAHLALQRFALTLRDRGIVLAVCSKNNDEVARRVFREHPEMILKEDHVAVFQANWDDKASNIRAIAKELALGLDSLVFVDDNPMERGLVRQVLPQVAVPELPADPALYTRTLSSAGYFDTVTFSDEDRKRADFYQANAKRVAVQATMKDLDAYLASLDMEITFQPFDTVGRARIAQLINKSNQFNLTTRRYTEAEVAKIENDPACFTLQVRLADRFGDNGMISVIICREEMPKAWAIDTWLMSCRVLGRGVERMVLREILRQADRCAITKLVGRYRPTARNELVRDHYKTLGFALIRSEPDGATAWELDADARIDAAPMRVRRVGFEVEQFA